MTVIASGRKMRGVSNLFVQDIRAGYSGTYLRYKRWARDCESRPRRSMSIRSRTITRAWRCTPMVERDISFS
jgi:hypothetical protein